MKKLTIVSVFVMLIATQVTAQRVFTKVNLRSIGSQGILTFSLPSEVNVIHYRVEASNDNNDFEVLGTVISKGNSIFEKSYNYGVYNMGYKYYRVGKVSMNGSLQYSQVISVPDMKKNAPEFEPTIPAATIAMTNTQ